MPETIVDSFVDVVKVFLQNLKITSNGVDFVFEFLHGGIILADQFVELLEFLLIEEARLFWGQLFLSFFIGLFDVLYALVANF